MKNLSLALTANKIENVPGDTRDQIWTTLSTTSTYELKQKPVSQPIANVESAVMQNDAYFL